MVLWVTIAGVALLIVPPLYYLLQTSLTVGAQGARPQLVLEHYLAIFELGGWRVWRVTLLYAAGSSCIALGLGVSAAWLIARTNALFQHAAIIFAYLSLAVPVMIKGIGWILLLGPNNGLINVWLRELLGTDDVTIPLFTLGGMTVLEGLLWSPVVLLLAIPVLRTMDPALEEAAFMAGARRPQIFWRVTVPLAAPGLLAILLLTFIRSLESFEVPLLIGSPGNLQTFTTAIYETIHRGFVPQYGEASAYAVVLMLVMLLPLFFYYRTTRQSQKYATISARGFQSSRIDLRRWRPIAGCYLLIIPLSVAAPLGILLWSSFLPNYAAPSWSAFARMSLENYQYVLTRPLTLGGFGYGFLVATLSSTIVAAFTLFVAWQVVRRRERARWMLDALCSFPLLFPAIVLATALMIEFLHLRFIPIYETIWIMVLAFLIKFMPYGIRFSYAGVTAISPQLEESARSCGASTFRMLWRIVLPLALPSVATVWVYVFLHSIRDLSIPLMLAGPDNQLIAAVILDLWNDGKIPQVGALSMLLAAAVTFFGWLLMSLSRRYNNGLY
jgi:iron(III) transport system permease protein